MFLHTHTHIRKVAYEKKKRILLRLSRTYSRFEVEPFLAARI